MASRTRGAATSDPDRGVSCNSWEQGCRGRGKTVCCDEFHEKSCAGSKVTQCCGRGQTCEDNGDCICKPDRPVDCLDDCCKKTEKCCTSPTGKGFCIPKAHTELSTPRVLTMDMIDGIPVAQTGLLEAAGIDREEVFWGGIKVHMSKRS